MIMSDTPRPKLRVTSRCSTPSRPHASQISFIAIDRDNEEPACRADLDDGFGRAPNEGCAVDDVFDFARLAIALPFADFPCEEDAIEVEDREVVIFQLIRRMQGNRILEITHQLR